MSIQRYSLPAMVLHWFQAVLVICLLWLGWTMLGLPKGAERSAAYGLHKSLGLLALLMVLARLAWRLRSPAPALSGSALKVKLAQGAHVLLYAFLVLAPLAGYLASSFTPYPLKFFGFEILKAGWPDEGFNAIFKQVHVILVWGGAGLIGLHIVAALKHAIAGDGVMHRMLPGWLFNK